MELYMTFLPHQTTELDVIEALAEVLHRPPVAVSTFAAPVNFSVNVFTNRSKKTGKLQTSANITLADAFIAQNYIAIHGATTLNHLRIKGVPTRSYVARKEPDPARVQELRANPFVSPVTARKREEELKRLRVPIALSGIAFGRVVDRRRIERAREAQRKGTAPDEPIEVELDERLERELGKRAGGAGGEAIEVDEDEGVVLVERPEVREPIDVDGEDEGAGDEWSSSAASPGQSGAGPSRSAQASPVKTGATADDAIDIDTDTDEEGDEDLTLIAPVRSSSVDADIVDADLERQFSRVDTHDSVAAGPAGAVRAQSARSDTASEARYRELSTASTDSVVNIDPPGQSASPPVLRSPVSPQKGAAGAPMRPLDPNEIAPILNEGARTPIPPAPLAPAQDQVAAPELNGHRKRNHRGRGDKPELVFSPEYERSAEVVGGGTVLLDGEKRQLVVNIGRGKTDATVRAAKLIIPVSSIHRIDALADTTCILLTLSHAPQCLVTAPDHGPEQRQPALDADHARIAALCSTSLLLDFPERHQVERFIHLRGDTMRLPKVQKSKIAVDRAGLYSEFDCERLQAAMRELPIEIAFQIEILYRSECFAVFELLSLLPVIRRLVVSEGVSKIERALQRFAARLGGTLPEQWVPSTERGAPWQDDTDPAANPADEDLLPKMSFSEGFDARLLELAVQKQERFGYRRSKPESVFMSRHVFLTPTREILEGPLPDESNSIVRRYPDQAAHFLRVTLREEDTSKISASTDYEIRDLLFARYRPIFVDGLKLAGRKFEFLGYSQSALKDHSTWFLAPFVIGSQRVSAATIRAGLGDFTKVINNPARYMARLAQAFTATRSSLHLTRNQIVRIPDINSLSGSCFTDGVGKISPALAEEVDEVLRATRGGAPKRTQSSCYQFRLGGAKGMLMVDPLLSGKIVQLRPSQIKYEGTSLSLDIASTFGRPLTCYLNRPLIKILEDLGIPPTTFVKIQTDVVSQIYESSHSLSKSARLLDRVGLGESAKLPSLFRHLASVLSFEAADLDPFLATCEEIAISEALKTIKFKARIPLSESWTLVGVADEDNYLRPGEIYACIKDPGSPPRYLQGRVCVSRSPTIHPGDVQVVEAIGRVDPQMAPRLHSLVNCVVFSVKGTRSLPSCLGGGDLDGDLYSLIALPSLVPHDDALYDPASYHPATMNTLDRSATIEDGIDFFLEYITSDFLGMVASRHLHYSDFYPQGTKDQDCLALAQLHSDAVDYPKSGTPIEKRDLPKPPSKLRPQFMCGEFWAHQKDGEGRQWYTSDKALGQMFRAIPLKDIKAPVRRIQVELEHFDGHSIITDALAERIAEMTGTRPSKRLLQQDEATVAEIRAHLTEFSEWLSHCATVNTMSTRADRRLSEAEVVLGTILAPARDPRLRQDKAARLQLQTAEIFDELRIFLVGHDLRDENDDDTESVGGGLTVVYRQPSLVRGDRVSPEKLGRCWTAWLVACSTEEFGAKTFAVVTLGLLLDMLR